MDIGSVLKLHNDNIVVVIGVIVGGLFGTFYTVIDGDIVREINEADIKEVVNER